MNIAFMTILLIQNAQKSSVLKVEPQGQPLTVLKFVDKYCLVGFILMKEGYGKTFE